MPSSQFANVTMTCVQRIVDPVMPLACFSWQLHEHPLHSAKMNVGFNDSVLFSRQHDTISMLLPVVACI